MPRRTYARLTFVLSMVAAALALSAALVRYLKEGEVNVAIIAAGIFLLAFGFGARGRQGIE